MSLAAETLEARAGLIHAVETSGVIEASAAIVPQPSWMAPADTEASAAVAGPRATTERPRAHQKTRAVMAIGIAFVAASGIAVMLGKRGTPESARPAAGADLTGASAPASAARPAARVVDIESAQAPRPPAPRASAALTQAPGEGSGPGAEMAAAPEVESPAPSATSPKYRGIVPARPRGRLEKAKAAHAKDFFPDDL
jgi:hypothetical protein